MNRIFKCINKEGGGVDCDTFQNQHRNSAKKRVTALIFGMLAAIMMYIIELWRNGGGITTTAENRHLLSIFLPFLPELYIFESFEIILFFSKKITFFAFDTCNISSNILLFNQKKC